MELLSGGLSAWVALYKKDAFANIKNKLDDSLVTVMYRDKRKYNGKTFSDVILVIGLFFLLYGYLQVNNELNFPGKWALVPVLGAILIIMVGSEPWINKIILSNKIAV